MTATADVFRDPRVRDVLRRCNAPGGYEAFATQVRGARACRRPIRLRGRVTERDEQGQDRVVFDTASLPDGVLLKACGTRRETLCPPCASIYRGDAFQLIASGLRGGKGIPDAVQGHPAVLVTLTAPSFGPVHRRRPDQKCHPQGRRCRCGRALVCGACHDEGDDILGEALCPTCYDYEGAVLFNARISELWRRTTIYILRALGSLGELSVRQAAKTLRLSYVKVAEFQARGSVHLHAVIRLDARADGLEAPPAVFDATLLARAVHSAARKVSAPGPDGTRLRWGAEIDVAVIDDEGQSRAGAAWYLGKYCSKGTDPRGVLDHRLHAGVPPRLPVPRHVFELVSRAWELAGDPGYDDLHFKRWAHTLGYRGHFLTKSRRYSTTFAALREERMAWTMSTKAEVTSSVQPSSDDEDTEQARWSFVGAGYASAGDAWIAASLAEDLRHAKWLQRSDEGGWAR